jgi:hypothetical protein
MLGSGKLNTVIPQLRAQLAQLEGEELKAAVRRFGGSYAHKNQMAGQMSIGAASLLSSRN